MLAKILFIPTLLLCVMAAPYALSGALLAEIGRSKNAQNATSDRLSKLEEIATTFNNLNAELYKYIVWVKSRVPKDLLAEQKALVESLVADVHRQSKDYDATLAREDGETGEKTAPLVAEYTASLANVLQYAALDTYLAMNFMRQNNSDFSALFGEVDDARARARATMERASAEIDAAIASALTSMVAGLIGAAAIGFGASVYLGARTSRPISDLQRAASNMAEGCYEDDVPHRAKRDEIGALARAIDVLRANGEARLRLEAQRKDYLAALEEAIGAFQRGAAEKRGVVEASVHALEGSSREICAQVAETDANVARVAASAEQFSTSIEAIAGSSASVREAAALAVRNVEQCRAVVADLESRIGGIDAATQMIDEIADRTNLLALNATIEAARAGEHGRGFGVVASEVKALALQTSRATAEIAESIEATRLGARSVATAMREIASGMDDIDRRADFVSGSVDTQSEAMAEIARSARDASAATRAVASEMLGENGGARASVRGRIEALEGNYAALDGEIRGFLDRIKAL